MDLDEIITRRHLEEFKKELFHHIDSFLEQSKPTKRWIREKELKELTGWSSSTIQTNRINGSIKYSKIGGTLFYDLDFIQCKLESNSKPKQR